MTHSLWAILDRVIGLVTYESKFFPRRCFAFIGLPVGHTPIWRSGGSQLDTRSS